MRSRAVLVVAVALVAVGLTACSGSATVRLRVERTGSVTWTPCGDVQCASLEVPVDNARPDGPRLTLAMARRPATGRRIGVLLVNPGGPGGSGVEFMRHSSDAFRSELFRAFDVVSWDPRGVGQSAPVDCGTHLDPFYAVDRNPTTPAEVAENVAAARELVTTCERNSRAELPYVATDATVRDMDAIRAAIGEDRITYYGFSYGTYLGALYAEAFPQRLRAAVLDGAIDPALSYTATTIEQATGFERALDDFLAWCRGDSDCKFARGGDPRRAFDSLQRMITAEPVPGKVDDEERTLGPGEFDIGVASALYGGHTGYVGLSRALAQAGRGTGSDLLRLSDQYTGRRKGGEYSNETAALYATGCIDAPAARSLTAVQQLADAAARVAPHFGPTTAWLGLPCTYWPIPAVSKPAPVHAEGAPPILVVGTTRDPATPYTWAQSLAQQLRTGHLLTFEGDGHTAYGRGSGCIDRAVDDYLHLDVPPPGTTCR